MGSKRLGKGLGALLPSVDVTEDDVVNEVDISELRANPYQPRKQFDPEALEELASRSRSMGSFSRWSSAKAFTVMRSWRANAVSEPEKRRV